MLKERICADIAFGGWGKEGGNSDKGAPID
jgi:hypothetical protein